MDFSLIELQRPQGPQGISRRDILQFQAESVLEGFVLCAAIAQLERLVLIRNEVTLQGF